MVQNYLIISGSNSEKVTNREIFHKYIGMTSPTPMGIEVEKAEGIFLFDPEGKRYFDLVSGVAVCNTGHRHPAILKAVNDQLDKYLHLMVYGEFIQSPQVQFAKMLADHLPESLSCNYFVNSGSEAIEGAMKLAKRYTGRTGILSFRKAYHGSTQGSLSILGDESLKNAFRPLLPGIRHIRFNNFEDLDHIDESVACIVVETIQAEAGVILPVDGYLEALRRRCTEKRVLLVMDEVQTGLGRTGKLFAFEHYGVIPDILVLAKGLGGGMPLGAFISSHKIMSSLTHHPELGHITTFGGHPVCCAAAIANLEVILKENLISQVEEKGNLFIELLGDHPAVKAIRNKGLMMALELHHHYEWQKVLKIFIANGIITETFLFDPHSFRLAPPLTITPDEIREACERIRKGLSMI